MQREGIVNEKALHLRVSQSAESAVRSGHPWIFGDSVRECSRSGKTGEIAVVYDRKDRFLAVGLFDAESPIRLRVLEHGRPCRIDKEFWGRRMDRAVAARCDVADHETDGYRVVHGESDGWPGLVVDRYGDVLVVKIYTAAWVPWLEVIRDELVRILSPSAIVLRMGRHCSNAVGELGIPAIARKGVLEGSPLRDGIAMYGTLENDTVPFRESGLFFEAEVVRGQKTGFFLDQRENRRRVEGLVKGRFVVNTFSYSGGFSVYAARGGATRVIDVDVSAPALEAGRRNFERNAARGGWRCTRQGLKADVFEWFRETSPTGCGLIVVDPPSMAKREIERGEAIRQYGRLASGAIRQLRGDGGILVAASCSSHVSEAEFFEAVLGASRMSGSRFVEIERTGHPRDHPSSFAEAAYLKCIYLRFG